jgi:hypothetical protein
MRDLTKRIQATGILNINIIGVNDHVFEWLEADTFTLANLARSLGIDIGRKAKATVTIEIVKGLCEICGMPATGDKLCDKCGKMICTRCAHTDLTGTYCSSCRDQKSKRVSE